VSGKVRGKGLRKKDEEGIEAERRVWAGGVGGIKGKHSNSIILAVEVRNCRGLLG